VASDESRIGGLALRYATAVFELAAEERALDTLAADLAALKAMLAASPELTRLGAFATVLARGSGQGHGSGAEAGRFRSLARRLRASGAKRRLFALSEIIRAFEKLLARQRGEVPPR
jgi:F-type H+-transporting ATPase subunit delta